LGIDSETADTIFKEVENEFREEQYKITIAKAGDFVTGGSPAPSGHVGLTAARAQ